MWLNEDDIEWYATMVEIMGKEKAPQFMRRLAQQDLRYGSDPSLAIELLCAGEFPLMIGIHFHHTERLKQKGCPLDWVVAEPGYNRPPIAIGPGKERASPYCRQTIHRFYSVAGRTAGDPKHRAALPGAPGCRADRLVAEAQRHSFLGFQLGHGLSQYRQPSEIVPPDFRF